MSNETGAAPTIQFATSVNAEEAAAVIAVVTAALEARAAAMSTPGHDAVSGWASKANLVRSPITVGAGQWNRTR